MDESTITSCLSDTQSLVLNTAYPVELNLSPRRYICSQCDHRSDYLEGLKLHLREQHDLSSCWVTDCDQTFREHTQLHEHLERIHSIRTVECPYTYYGVLLQNYEDIHTHLGSHHHFSARPYPTCYPYQHCQKRFESQDTLDDHVAAHICKDGREAFAETTIDVSPIEGKSDRSSIPIQLEHKDDGGEIARADTIPIAQEGIQAIGRRPVKSSLRSSVPHNQELATSHVLRDSSCEMASLSSEYDYNFEIRALDGFDVTGSNPTLHDCLELLVLDSNNTTIDDYPELLALDESERPGTDIRSDVNYISGDFTDPAVDREMFRSIIVVLGLNKFVSPDELLDLWTVFLDYEQRVLALKQLAETDWLGNLKDVVHILRASGLGALTEAWASFKALLYILRGDASSFPSAAGIISMILMNCSALENLMNRGYPRAIESGMYVPDLLLSPSTLPTLAADTPIIDLLSALEERVKCRKAHPEWLQFTRIMVLSEMCKYLSDLIVVVNAIYLTKQDNVMLQSYFGPVVMTIPGLRKSQS